MTTKHISRILSLILSAVLTFQTVPVMAESTGKLPAWLTGEDETAAPQPVAESTPAPEAAAQQPVPETVAPQPVPETAPSRRKRFRRPALARSPESGRHAAAAFQRNPGVNDRRF